MNDNRDYNDEKYDFELFEVANKNTDKKEKTDLDDRSVHKVRYSPKSKNRIASIFEWLDVIVASLVAVVIIFTFVFRIVAIDGSSMNNTLFHGERVIITNLFYEPERGDIIVISRNKANSSESDSYEKPIIKRIIAIEGDLVDIDFEKGQVFVNGELLKEDYIKEPTYASHDVTFPVRVPENCVFVLGDNRNDSKDSRFSEIGDHGMVNEKYILGHAVLRVFPINKFGKIDK